MLKRQYQTTKKAIGFAKHLGMLGISLAFILCSHLICANALSNDIASAQRVLYTEAKQAFKKGDQKQYLALKAQLTHYPLYPYLEYAELSKGLSLLNKRHVNRHLSANAQKQLKQQISAFLKTHHNTHLGNVLLSKWLKYLAARKKWRDYKHYYQPHVKSTVLHCHYLQSQVNTGEPLPVAAIEALWLSAKSQPDECDGVFLQWSKAGHMTQKLLWQRHKLVIHKRNYGLAHYLQKKMHQSTQFLSRLYENVHRYPNKIRQLKKLTAPIKNPSDATTQKIISIIENGIYRYASKEPLKSLSVLNRLKENYRFDESTLQKLHHRIAVRLIRKDKPDAALALLTTIAREERGEPVERLLRHYLTQQEWAKVLVWVERLPTELAQSQRWQYWKARALEQTGGSATAINAAYKTLANYRSFYGFLAADKINMPYQFEDKPAPIYLSVIKKMRTSPSFQRAKELFLLKDMYVARIEWRYGEKDLTKEEFIAAGQLAHLWGWNRKAIESMAKAKYWDDLTIRFPLVHTDIIEKKAKQNNVSSSLVFSIARQESAWEFDARSPVGARGLMQIMPATAKQTARRAKVRYSRRKLYDPSYNILLGSYYISELLRQHNNNRALAIAAYNAGPHRVKQWLAKTQASLPIDIWVEIIPFKETRKYVQNVLSYEVIHHYRQGREANLLTVAEANSVL